MRDPHVELAMAGILRWITESLGLHIESMHVATMESRIEQVCRRLRVTPAELKSRLDRSDAEASICVAEEASTNHTYFFREPEVFDYLESTIFPSLPEHGPLRFWSAATSSGEEAYSIAISAHDVLGGTAARERMNILSTDISERRIRIAERRIFAKKHLVSVRERRLSHFEDVPPHDKRVRTEVASSCTFRRLNLTRTPWPFQAQFHVIFLRNVLYYFDEPTRDRVLESCASVAGPAGWLVTSLTEPMLDRPRMWVPCAPGIYRRATGEARRVA